MFFVGLDVHQRRSSVCVLNEHGKKVKEFEVLGSWDQLLEALARLPRPMAVCFEASTGCGWLYERIAPLARRVEVAHPGQVRLIFRAKKKNDRIDAAKLATLLFLDQAPKAYIPDGSVRAWRGLVEFRRRTVDKRTRAKNGLRALFRPRKEMAAASHPFTPRPDTAMTVYETTNPSQIRMWCESNHYWPACLAGQPDRVRIGGVPFAEPEELDLIDWDDWFVAFEKRKLKFVYDPIKAWCDLQARNVRPD